MYYVDWHKQPATSTYQNKCIYMYLKQEHIIFRWIQINKKRNYWIAKQWYVPSGSGYQVTADKGCKTVGYHVDSHEILQKKMNKDILFCECLNVCKYAYTKPLIFFGRNECMSKHYMVTNKNWCTVNDTTFWVPKSDNHSVMISVFQSWDFGIGMKLVGNEIKRVNTVSLGKTYVEKDDL